MNCERIVFSGHAIQRMFERRLSGSDVRSVLRDGEEIASYPDDAPYSSCIMLGFWRVGRFILSWLRKRTWEHAM